VLLAVGAVGSLSPLVSASPVVVVPLFVSSPASLVVTVGLGAAGEGRGQEDQCGSIVINGAESHADA
jgi:hypothetical protein